jgi:pimeloyl-ACP methyl ester carboxylesterase
VSVIRRISYLMMYWLCNAAASSERLYWESFNSFTVSPVEISTGYSIFPKEIYRISERWAKKRFTHLVHFSVVDQGGHFAAFEQPVVFVNEIRSCFRPQRT